MTAAIETRGLSRRFGRVEAVMGMDLAVPEGSIYAFLGPNGAGKTTTIHMLMNLICPSAGSAEVLGVDSRRLAARDLESIGYVSENQKLPDWMRIGEFLDFCAALYPSWDRQYCDALVDQFELPREQKLKHCSRGMRMKAALISSLAYRPRLLVLDEPFSGLDPGVRDDMAAGIGGLARERGTTVFVSSHDVVEVEALCDQVGFLRRGELIASESLEDLVRRFRRVVVEHAEEPSDWPQDWLRPEKSDGSLTFVHARFDAEATPGELRERFGQDANWRVEEVSLREIFVALSKRTAG